MLHILCHRDNYPNAPVHLWIVYVYIHILSLRQERSGRRNTPQSRRNGICFCNILYCILNVYIWQTDIQPNCWLHVWIKCLWNYKKHARNPLFFLYFKKCLYLKTGFCFSDISKLTIELSFHWYFNCLCCLKM